MRKVSIIGIGAGNPDYLTLQAIAAIKAADTFFIPDKGDDKLALRAVREEMLARHGRPGQHRVEFEVPERDRSGAYQAGVAAWRDALRATYRDMLHGLGDGETGAFLVWGDPALYDGTIVLLREIGAEVEVIPGISAVQALAARHRIPLNRVGEAVTITTARRVRDGEADRLGSFIVMLDSDAAWKRFVGEAGTEIFWGAYLGMGEEVLVAGRLSEVAAEIERVRAEARARNGWIMDSYLIRRQPG